ncbi:MAG: NADH:ubiquinone reductase (Na(+)-transporting) subunit C [Bacteroidales bacterium]|jgi:Na+-transporting NADH:ubiquinone oxidoreductase subunit C|nr:NADH:ubiquinone reductase (Na(+)-transporting) subunit C [Bacteroidales bacterium]MDG2082131.1 NADH:ubiquinone reductase (Na(+)-transporting) subunit C [Bacteroidales bacterium]
MYTNAYIFKYASIMVIITAAILSAAAMLLKPFQETNAAIDKMGGILVSAEVPNVDADNAMKLFNKFVTEEIVVDRNGDIVDVYKGDNMENGKAFNIDLKKELYRKSKNEPFELPVYVVEIDNDKLYIFPLRGVGLWGPVWGNIALDDDLSTIKGVKFDHAKETPGLGAEISTNMFSDQFRNKKIFNSEGDFTSITVKKGGVETLPENQQIHGVDAITGGTITSDGVNDMIYNVLEAYLPFIEKERKK